MVHVKDLFLVNFSWLLRITYNNKSSSFQDSLDKNNSVPIHHRNIRTLAIEIQSSTRAFPPLLNEVFVERNCNYNLQGNNYVISLIFRAKNMGHLTKGNKEFWNAKCIQIKIQKLGSSGMPCRLCKTYVSQLGCIWETITRQK